MSSGRRRPGVRGAAALLLLGVLCLGTGVLLHLHDRDDRRVVAQDVGEVPGSPAGPAGSAPVADALPVLSGVDDPGPVPGVTAAPGPTGVSGLAGGFDDARPSGAAPVPGMGSASGLVPSPGTAQPSAALLPPGAPPGPPSPVTPPSASPVPGVSGPGVPPRAPAAAGDPQAPAAAGDPRAPGAAGDRPGPARLTGIPATGVATSGPGRPVPAGARTVEPEPRFADPGPAPVPPRVAPRPLRPLPVPLFPQEPGLVSPVYPLPRPAPAVAPVPVVPATLELPARAVTAPVDAVGTDPSGGMVVPEQVRTVGWWAPGVLPGGAAGSAVIAGHVDSRLQGVGVLAVLPTLLEGEPLVVRDARGRAAVFRVAARREYGKYDLPRDVFRRTGPPQLVLITCGGRFDPAARSYESNIVVYAVPV